ncbi:MAG: malto-oligosyltrehalose synthase [Bacillota bacterium]
MVSLRIPGATYRLQFNERFRFGDAHTLVPYLYALGITDLYASPVLQARKGSTHGYDITDPERLSRDLGGEEAFFGLSETLRQHQMGLLLDIVPNHMAADSENPWWADVLQNGPDSPYATYFDIDWRPVKPGLQNKVLLPVLGAPYGEELENQQLTLGLGEDGFTVRYYKKRFPLNFASYSAILNFRFGEFTRALGNGHHVVTKLADLIGLFAGLPGRTGENGFQAAARQAKEMLWDLYNGNGEVRAFIDENLRLLNGIKGDPRSFDRLDRLLSAQAYRLAWWRTANREINYRRFFDVSDLVSTRVEEEHVFAARHSRLLELAGTDVVTGFRIDHIDGLFDPAGYLRRLQNRLGTEESQKGFYVIAEKILTGDEDLPNDWPVYGTTGYDFLNIVNGLFVDRNGLAELDKVYRELTGSRDDFSEVVYTRKRQVIEELFAGELCTLSRQLARLGEKDRHACDLSLPELEQAITEVTACLPVYRTYTNSFSVTERDRKYINEAVNEAIRRRPDSRRACEFLRRVLLLSSPDSPPARRKREWLRFVMSWQQFTGPVMAKGYEDTALYVYNRLISMNEVGGDPQSMGVSVEEFHRYNRSVMDRRPHTMNATSTHDTKRSEDVRARISVLSEMPRLWAEKLQKWCDWNRAKKKPVGGNCLPDINAEILLYQTLVGAWPLHQQEIPEFEERLKAYLVKAAREAKTFSSWINPNADYEKGLTDFAALILEPGDKNLFFDDFVDFQRVIAYYGALNSLAQVLLKITSPGVPDFYQGMEIWNFSLVDPDNRRPVDFEARAAMLSALQEQEAAGLQDLVQELLANWEDGRIKLFVTYKALNYRRNHRELFTSGGYLPVHAIGPRNEHVCAFARRLRNKWVLTVVPRLALSLQRVNEKMHEHWVPKMNPPLGEAAWGECDLILPANSPERWYNHLTGETLSVGAKNGADTGRVLRLAAVFNTFPLALLEGVVHDCSRHRE